MAKLKVPTVNEKLLQRYIRHAVYLEQLKAGEARAIGRFLKQKTFPQIYDKLMRELGKVKDLKSIGSIYKIKHLKRMLAATQKISTAGMVKAKEMMVSRLVNISKFEAQWNVNMISKTVPIDIDMTMPSNEVLRKLVTMRPMDGHKLATWMAGYSTAVRVAMTKQIKVGISTGESLPQIGRRINKALNWKGKQAEYIARTAVSNVVHQAKEEVFKKNKDIIRKVQLVATLDDRTSLECISIDGNVYDVGVGPRPPIHFNCRTTAVPLTPSWQEFGVKDPPAATRASMNGAVPSKINYRQWLKTQPKAVQVKVLGKKRAELYRTGRVRINKFVGKDLKPLTLKQLAKREGLDIAPAPPEVFTSFRGTTKDFQEVISNHLDKIPKRIKEVLNENNVKFQFGEKLTEMLPDLKGLTPRGWAPGSTFDSCKGVFRGAEKAVYISEKYLPRGGKNFIAPSYQSIKTTVFHETGHAFDFVQKRRFSDNLKFKKAYTKDVASLSQDTVRRNRIGYMLQKGEAGRQETFAEIFAEELGQGSYKLMGREKLSVLMPKTAEYVRETFKVGLKKFR